jgi:hypothetical protein
MRMIAWINEIGSQAFQAGYSFEPDSPVHVGSEQIGRLFPSKAEALAWIEKAAAWSIPAASIWWEDADATARTDPQTPSPLGPSCSPRPAVPFA